MKKLFLVAAASATILSSVLSFADCSCPTTKHAKHGAVKHHHHGCGAEKPACPPDDTMMMDKTDSKEGKFYARIGLGGSIFDRQKDKTTGLKMKSNTSPLIEIAGGYYITDIARVDLSLATVLRPVFHKAGYATRGPVGDYVTAKHKSSSIWSLMVNGFVDVFDAKLATIFVGAGVGPSYLKEKVTIFDSTLGTVATASTKKKIDFAYQGSIGASAKLTDGFVAEIVYSYRGYGKTKHKRLNDVSYGGTRYQGNNVSVGLRVDI